MTGCRMPTNTNKDILSTSQWLARITNLDPDTLRTLRFVYGDDRDVIEERLTLLRNVLKHLLEAFGDRPTRIFRSPGRINLRGMHVDTHGGFLNLMTHQREVVVAASPAEDGTFRFLNSDTSFPKCQFTSDEIQPFPDATADWRSFIMLPEIRTRVQEHSGEWSNYIHGVMLKAVHLFPGQSAPPIHAVIGSDLPRGAALSSSAALCTAALLAVLGWSDLRPDVAHLICAARDAEWYTGSRCGLSDQTAMIMAGRNELLNVALSGHELNIITQHRLPWPRDLKILVVNSHTERSISGKALVDYTRNRFAYSLALEILRQEAQSAGLPDQLVAKMGLLSSLSSSNFEREGGSTFLLELLTKVPERISLETLKNRYVLPNLDQSYQQYFGTVPESLRPKEIGLRGPLLFGIAESERARVFAEGLASGDYERLGWLMSLGHDGDRRIAADGSPWQCDVDDSAIFRAIEAKTPLEMLPGAYGASSPVLDRLVDTAVHAGALGASLTGAGIAGTVLALCTEASVDRVAEALRAELCSPGYARLAGRDEPIPSETAACAVVVNSSPAPAGELVLAG